MISDVLADLAIDPVPEVILNYQQEAVTGRVTFSHHDRKVYVSFVDGEIVHVTSNDPDRRLGECLLNKSQITLRQYNQSVQALLDTGKRQGEFFIEQEILTASELASAVRDQMREIVYELMLWEEGSYHFKPKPAAEESILIETSNAELILRGAARCRSFSRLRTILTPLNRLCAVNTDIALEQARRIRLKEDETNVLAFIDGKQSIADTIHLSPLSDIRTMQILSGLWWAKIVTFTEKEDSQF